MNQFLLIFIKENRKIRSFYMKTGGFDSVELRLEERLFIQS